jgi:hypothetical protein
MRWNNVERLELPSGNIQKHSVINFHRPLVKEKVVNPIEFHVFSLFAEKWTDQ